MDNLSNDSLPPSFLDNVRKEIGLVHVSDTIYQYVIAIASG